MSSSSEGEDDEDDEDDEDLDADDDEPILEPRDKKARKQAQASVRQCKVNPVENYESVDVKPLVPEATGGRWWTLPPLPEGLKWQTFRHNGDLSRFPQIEAPYLIALTGVLFPPPYEPHNVKMLYDGKPVDLTPDQEEIMTFYAVMIDSDMAKKPKFRENFFKDWKEYLGPDHIIQCFEKCDFTPVYEWHVARRAAKKQEGLTKDEKRVLNSRPEVIAEKERALAEKKRLEQIYGFAVVDGCRERVGNFKVEPPGLFRGRGDHPKTGKLKRRVQPEDITLNIGPGEPIPKCPIEGHNWKGVIHNDRVTWLAFWTENICGATKYIYLHSSSRFKGQSDIDKFEKVFRNARRVC